MLTDAQLRALRIAAGDRHGLVTSLDAASATLRKLRDMRLVRLELLHKLKSSPQWGLRIANTPEGFPWMFALITPAGSKALEAHDGVD